MTDIDDAVSGITKLAVVGIVAKTTFKGMDNVNRLSKPQKRIRKRRTHRRKR